MFGPNGQRVLTLITGIPGLTARQVDQVTIAWKQNCPRPRRGLGQAQPRDRRGGAVPDAGRRLPGPPRGAGDRPSSAPGGLGVLGGRVRRRRRGGGRRPARQSLRHPGRPARGGDARTRGHTASAADSVAATPAGDAALLVPASG
jgi:hypothetical protein